MSKESSNETKIEPDSLFITCDEKKWCISKSALVQMFSETPIFLCINEYVSEYRFIHQSPEYIEIFVKLLRREISIFNDFKREYILPKIHIDFFGIQHVRDNIIKSFFNTRNIDNILSNHNLPTKIEYELLDNVLKLSELLNPTNIYLKHVANDICFKYIPDNTSINCLIKLLNVLSNIQQLCSYKVGTSSYGIALSITEARGWISQNLTLKVLSFTKDSYLRIDSLDYLVIKSESFPNLLTDEKCQLLEHKCPEKITAHVIDSMNFLSELFGDTLIIDDKWFNYSFADYHSEHLDDNIKERSDRYYRKIQVIIDEFDEFFNIFKILNEAYPEYLSSF